MKEFVGRGSELIDLPISPETKSEKLDAIVVLGKNIGVDWTKDTVRAQRFHLSPHARISVDAAYLLYRAGVTRKIIFSTGKTAGGDIPSEAELMCGHLLRISRGKIPAEDLILEGISWDTNTNAKAVRRKMREHGLKKVALMSVGFHLPRAVYLFERAGIVPVQNYASEEELARRFPRFVENYIRSDLYKREVEKEKQVLSTQKKLPPELVSLATWFTRNRTFSGLMLL